MSTSVCRLCLCVCLSVLDHISGTTCTIFTNFSVHVAYGCGSASSGRVTKSQGNGQFWRVFFPTDNALYSVAFRTHTKTAEPIGMPFVTMTPVGPRYHALDGGPDPARGRGNFGGKRSGTLQSNGTLYGELCKNG